MAKGTDNPYLRDAVMTATPEQLQLMLYDAAIRFATQAREAIQACEIEKSYDLLTRAQNVVREMENGLRHEQAPELCERMAALYRFVFSKLVDANVKKDVTAIDEAVKVLGHQRETWCILIDKVRATQVNGDQPVEPQPADQNQVGDESLSVEG